MKRWDYNYFISKERNDRFRNSCEVGEYVFQYNDNEVHRKSTDNRTLVLFGFAVDSHDYNRSEQDIVDELIMVESIEELLSISKKLAGKYLIIYKANKHFYIIPDATCSIQSSYTVEGYDLCISSNPKIIADYFGFVESEKSKEIKSKAHEMHPLPYDLSMYDQIRFIIPNFYFSSKKRISMRYYPVGPTRKDSFEKAVGKSIEMLNNIVKGYIKKFNLAIPLTAGIDSRTVLALFKDEMNNIPLYTFKHDYFTDDTSDICIPMQISNDLGLYYSCINDENLPEDIYKFYKNELGGNINTVIATNAYTFYKSALSGRAFVTGDIIPLVKSGFGKDLPERFASTQYLVTKTHNYSKQNKLEVRRWIKDTNKFTSKNEISKFDLFFWEHRIGKWGANNQQNYDLLSYSVNVFNCRELIESWISVPRSERVKKSMHHDIIKEIWPEILNYPINPDRKFQLIQDNAYLSYIASFVKYYMHKFK